MTFDLVEKRLVFFNQIHKNRRVKHFLSDIKKNYHQEKKNNSHLLLRASVISLFCHLHNV